MRSRMLDVSILFAALTASFVLVGCPDDSPVTTIDASDAGAVDSSAPADAQTSDAAESDADADAASSTETACDQTRPCGQGQLCAGDGFCVPACEAGGHCVIATSKRSITEVRADGETVYFVEGPTYDTLNNPRRDATIRRVAGAQVETFVESRGAVWTVRTTQTHVYWHDSGRIWRKLKTGASEPEPLYQTSCRHYLLLSDGRLAWSTLAGVFVGSGDGTAPASKMGEAASSGTTPSAEDICVAMAQEGTELFRPRFAVGPPPLFGFDLDSLQETDYGSSNGELLAVVARQAYWTNYTHNSVARFPLGGDGTIETVAKFHSDTFGWIVRIRIQPSWLYYFKSKILPNSVFELTVARASLTNLGITQTLGPAPFPLPPRYGAQALDVSATTLYLAASRALQGYEAVSLVYRFPLPAGG